MEDEDELSQGELVVFGPGKLFKYIDEAFRMYIVIQVKEIALLKKVMYFLKSYITSF
jgi:hypothetical protein